ncbi:MAG: hypothetical protein EXQ84_07720 [Rhodospirillaceae bacterium]|nr:hypothetical protein [Rhodospirillaceae bacterium]
MMDHKTIASAAALIIGMLAAAIWAALQATQTPLIVIGTFVTPIHYGMVRPFMPPLAAIGMWAISAYALRKRWPGTTDPTVRKFYDLALLGTCLVGAVVEALIIVTGADFEIGNGRRIGAALVGVLLLAIGNLNGKLPSPFKGKPEAFSWDQYSRFNGWVAIGFGLAMIAGAFTVPARAMTAFITVLWLTSMALMLTKKYLLKRDKQREMSGQT